MSPPLVPILSHMNPVHTFPICFSKIHFNMYCHLHLGLLNGHFPSGFLTKIFYPTKRQKHYTVRCTDVCIIFWTKEKLPQQWKWKWTKYIVRVYGEVHKTNCSNKQLHSTFYRNVSRTARHWRPETVSVSLDVVSRWSCHESALLGGIRAGETGVQLVALSGLE
jgi:hypothetical protein